jgi:rRNA-processing protein FCF1
MEATTELQEAIIKKTSIDREQSNTKIAEDLGCDPSYVSECRKTYSESIDEFAISTEWSTGFCFSNPYQVYVSEELLDDIEVDEGEVGELNFLCGRDSREFYAEINRLEDFDQNKEIHALFYALTTNKPNEFKSGLPEFDEFVSDDGEEWEIYTQDHLRGFLSTIGRVVRRKVTDNNLILGASVCEFIEDRESEKGIKTPFFKIDKEPFVEYIQGNTPDVYEISEHNERIHKPEQVYFMSLEGKVPDDKKEQVVSKISESKYIDLSIRRSFIEQGYNIYGPGLDESVISDSIGRVVEIDSETIEIVDEKARSLELSNSQDPFEFEKIVSVLDQLKWGKKEEGEDNAEDLEYTTHGEYNLIYVSLGPFIVTIFVQDKEVLFLYHAEVSQIEDNVTDIMKSIENNIDKEMITTTIGDIEHEKKLGAQKWTLDTNSIYHQISNDKASSILYTFIPTDELFNSEIIVPWVVLYEINSHKNTDDAGATVRQQGTENLEILSILDDYDFIDLQIEDVPSQVNGNVQSSAISDMHILSTAQSENSGLFTSDGELRRIANAAEVQAIDIREYATFEPETEPHQSIWENIEDDFSSGPIKREALVDLIVQKSREEIARSFSIKQTSKVDLREQAQDLIHQWVEKEMIVPFVDNSSILYADTQRYDIVPTYDLISHIPNNVEKHKGINYLNGTFLEKMRRRYGMPSNKRPILNFCVPESYVLKAQQECSSGKIEGTLKALLHLDSIQNSQYESISINNASSSNVEDDAIDTAKERDSLLLCRDGDENIDKLSGLLGVTVKKLVAN